MAKQSQNDPQRKIEELQSRLEELEQLIEAIKAGEVDAFAIRNTNNEPEVYALQSGDYAYRVLIEEIEEGALNVTEEGLIVYTNPCFCKFLDLPYEKIIGTRIFDFVHPHSKEEFNRLFLQSLTGKSKGEISFEVDGALVPAYVSLTSLQPKLATVGILITDLTEKIKSRRIEESAKELQQLVKQAPVSILLLEGKELVARVINETALMVMGKTENEVLNRAMDDFFPDLPETKKIYHEVFRTGIPYVGNEIQVSWIRDGKPHSGYFDLNYSPWYSSDGKIKGVMSVGVDVTEKVLARNQMDQNNAMIRNMYMTAPAFVAVFKGRNHVYELVNPYYQALIGEREVIGKPLLEAVPELKGQGIDTAFDHVYTTGETVIHRERLVMLARDKGKKPEEAYFDYSFQPMYDEEHKIIGVLAYGTDITQQVKARKIIEASASELEQKVKERTAELEAVNHDLIKSKEHFTLLFNVSPVAKSLSRASDGMVIDVNTAWEKMFGRKKEDVIGKTGVELGLISGTLRSEQVELMREKGSKMDGNEVKFHLQNGKFLYAFLSGTSIVLDGVEYLLTAYFDITERKKAEEKIETSANQLLEKNLQLEQINEELESFNYIASHDLQEPLRKIETFLLLLKKFRDDESRVNKYINITIESTRRMSLLIQSVLNYSRIPKRANDDFTDTDLNKVLDDVKADFELQIGEKSAIIQSDKLPTIKASPLQIQQLFANLIGNSLKFSAQKPHITIRSRIVNGDQLAGLNGNAADHPSPKMPVVSQKFAELKFTDNGIGFEPQYIKKIFDLFQRLHGRSEYSGTGIGLSIAKKIVEQHNGFITAESELNKGATFTVWLPVNDHADSPASAAGEKDEHG